MTNVQFAFRILFKKPLSALVTVLTLALLIGATSLGLGVFQHEQSAWMPFPESDRLVRLWHFTGDRWTENWFSPAYQELHEHLRGVELLGGYGGYTRYTLTKEGEAGSMIGMRVSAAVLEAAGVAPKLGRLFTKEEEKQWEDRLLLLSHSAWEEDFDRDRDIVGKSVQLNDQECQVVGVMPEGFNRNHLFYGIDFWVPGNFESPGLRTHMESVIGKLAPGVSERQLQAELEVVYPEIVRAAGLSWSEERQVNVKPLDKRPGLPNDLAEIFFMLAIIVFIALIASLNVTNVLLAHMSGRQKEFAMRFALGAKRGRLIAQVLAETIVLALVSAVIGVCAALGMSGLARAKGIEVEFNGTVIAWTLFGTVMIGLFVGWLPALRSTRRELLLDLKSGNPGPGSGRQTHRLRNSLVILQIAMAMALCTAGGLATRSFINKKNFDPGFELTNLLELQVSLRGDRYPKPPERIFYADQALQRVAGVPGVERVEAASTLAVGRLPFFHGFQIENKEVPRDARRSHLTVVSPGYLDMLNVPILRGRGFTDRDKRGNEPVALVSQSLVRRHFADEDAIGKRIHLPLDKETQWFTIVGIVPDRRALGSQEDFGHEIYLCGYQVAPVWAPVTLLVRTIPNPGALRGRIRETVRSLDHDQPVSSVWLVPDRITRTLKRDKEMGVALGAVGLLGLFMAVVGIYGVVVHSVAQRTFEVGVRMAAGANKKDILMLILRFSFTLAGIGVAAGTLIAIGVTSGIANQFFGVSSFDPLTYFVVIALMFSTTIVAALFPALRATRINPIDALRCD